MHLKFYSWFIVSDNRNATEFLTMSVVNRLRDLFGYVRPLFATYLYTIKCFGNLALKVTNRGFE
jgi:hypothetical protein